MAGIGGKQPGAGRPKGSKTKTGIDLRKAAQAYTVNALATLASICDDKEQPAAARVSASKEILDRGHGKSIAVIEGQIVVKTHAAWLRELKEGSE